MRIRDIVVKREYKKIASLLILGVAIAIQHNKGERGGLGRLVQEISYWYYVNQCVAQIRVSADGSGGTDKDVAEAIDFTLQEIDNYIPEEKKIELGKTKLSGASTDQGGGGGGVGESCMEETE